MSQNIIPDVMQKRYLDLLELGVALDARTKRIPVLKKPTLPKTILQILVTVPVAVGVAWFFFGFLDGMGLFAFLGGLLTAAVVGLSACWWKYWTERFWSDYRNTTGNMDMRWGNGIDQWWQDMSTILEESNVGKMFRVPGNFYNMSTTSSVELHRDDQKTRITPLVHNGEVWFCGKDGELIVSTYGTEMAGKTPVVDDRGNVMMVSTRSLGWLSPSA